MRLWDVESAAARRAAARAHQATRDAMREPVLRWLGELGSSAAVAASIRSDRALDPAERHAALQVLLMVAVGH